MRQEKDQRKGRGNQMKDAFVTPCMYNLLLHALIKQRTGSGGERYEIPTFSLSLYIISLHLPCFFPFA